LSSFGAATSLRVIEPELDSIEIFDGWAASGGELVALNPLAPLKMKSLTEERFSPTIVTSVLAPRCTHSGVIDVIFGTG
jgi:hypothetical protein